MRSDDSSKKPSGREQLQRALDAGPSGFAQQLKLLMALSQVNGAVSSTMPHPEKPLRALRLEPTGAAAIGVGAVTLFDGAHHPLRHERLESVRVTLPPEADRAQAAEGAEIDLGVIARRYDARPVEADAWLGAAVKGRGEAPDEPETSLVLDIAGSRDAALRVSGAEIPLGAVLEQVCQLFTVVWNCIPGSPQRWAASEISRNRSRAR